MKLLWLLFFLLVVNGAEAQDSITVKNGLKIIRNRKEYLAIAAQKPKLAMVDVKQLVTGVILDLRYATNNNFTGQKIYFAATTTYLRKKAAKALAAVQKKLKPQGMGLKIFDAYRPYSATQLIWNLVKDDRYAANPAKGSNHNRGIAVDITIVDLKTNKELDMGTGFDNFSDTAHYDFKALPDTVIKNRLLLRGIMEESGFKAMETEWWHYALPDVEKYEMLDLSFEELSKLQRKKKKH